MNDRIELLEKIAQSKTSEEICDNVNEMLNNILEEEKDDIEAKANENIKKIIEETEKEFFKFKGLSKLDELKRPSQVNCNNKKKRKMKKLTKEIQKKQKR